MLLPSSNIEKYWLVFFVWESCDDTCGGLYLFSKYCLCVVSRPAPFRCPAWLSVLGRSLKPTRFFNCELPLWSKHYESNAYTDSALFPCSRNSIFTWLAQINSHGQWPWFSEKESQISTKSWVNAYKVKGVSFTSDYPGLMECTGEDGTSASLSWIPWSIWIYTLL